MGVCKLLYWFSVLIVTSDLVLGRTIYLELNTPTGEELSFLKKYGYLPDAQGEVDFAYTPHSVAEAVRKMQAFAGLPQTGQLDFNTRQLFKKKRCGVKDIDNTSVRSRRYILQQGWNKKSITYRVENGSRTLPKHRAESLMEAGLAVWAPHGGLRFTRQDRGHADIKVSFASKDHGDGSPFDGPGLIVAHAFQPPHGEMHFDDDETWGEGADEYENVTDFFAVAVHEIGHALGLLHSNVKASVMYPYYQVPVEKLHLDDILGMQELYMGDDLPHESIAESGLEQSSAAPRSTRPDLELDENEIPDLCFTNYDTMQQMFGKLYVFEEEWMWVIKDKVVEAGYPRRFREVFRGLPRHVTYIKAIYQKRSGNVVIFSGRRYWEFSQRFRLVRSGRLTDYGLPRGVPDLTTAFLSNYNNKTYLVEYERFWRYDEDLGRMDSGYPKEMSAWRHVPYPVDAALIWNGDTYFFRGPRFWRFDNEEVRAHRHYPLPVAQLWLPCEPDTDMERYFTNDEP